MNEESLVAARRKSGRRLRIGFVVDSLGGGGAERVMVILANEFSKRQFDVDVIALRAAGPYRESLSPHVRLIDLKVSLPGSGASIKGFLLSLFRLARYLRREHPDVLMASMSTSSETAIAAVRVVGCSARVVIRPSNVLERPIPARVPPLRKFRAAVLGNNIFARVLYPFADAFVASSSGVLSSHKPILNPKTPAYIVRNPVVRPEIYDLAQRACDHEWLETPDRPVVLAVGRLAPAKDLVTLIRAFAYVRRERNARLIILGRGECKHQIEELVISENLSNDVDIAGYRENPYAFMSRASVFVLSSIWEGLPNALIEALALGCKVVSADSIGNGPREILDGGRFGWLVQPKDVESMGRAIVEALDGVEKGERQALAEHLKSFEVSYVCDQYERVFFPMVDVPVNL